jgi:predicted GNAT family N-acyltransferase
MAQTICALRSKTCLVGFRCGVSEIDQFCKTAFKKHSSKYPDYRVRVLYEGDTAIGMYTLSMSNPNESGRVLDRRSVYAGTSVFLYLDHLAIKEDRRDEKLSYLLMVDLLETLNGALTTFGRVFAVGLNAANSDAERFFTKWGFVKVSDSTCPFMVIDRQSLIEILAQIEAAA